MRLALGIFVLATLAAAAHAQTTPLSITLDAPHALHPGDHAEVIALVHVEDAARGPILITPSADGAAIEVVRGRLFRFDAEDPSADPLRFHVPVLARSVGTAVISVRIDGHVCEGPRCTPCDAEATARVDVR